jgi:S-adenosylmethionine:tRNA ribosyltransferase-isomerase
MRTEDFDYDLPPELIAQDPIEPRDSSRLLVLDRNNETISHRMFADFPGYLIPGDCLVINETKVMPARLLGRREGTGGQVEILLTTPIAGGGWEAMVKPGKRLAPGSRVTFEPPVLSAIIGKRLDGGLREIAFECEGDFRKALDKIGLVPLPPYITNVLKDKNRYQTVYAKKDGSVAAPTAGLHFTPELMKKIKARGIEVTAVDLTVGPGTFQPVKAESIEDHIMHSERFEMPEGAAATINAARENGGRIIAVGTTSARVLETMTGRDGITRAGAGATDIFIYPGYDFKAVDGLLTNFHLPKSTLLMLVCALAGREIIIKAYEEAVQRRYRFFSFGDAMLIL